MKGETVKLAGTAVVAALLAASVTTAVTTSGKPEDSLQVDVVTYAKTTDGKIFLQYSASGKDEKGQVLIERGDQTEIVKRKKEAEAAFQLATEIRAKPDAGY